MAVKLKSEDEMRTMREAGQIVGQTLAQIREMIRPGLCLLEIERFVAVVNPPRTLAFAS